MLDLNLTEADLIEVANQVVDFPAACRHAGIDVPEARDHGTRAWCPFGEFSHPDGGQEKAMRVWRDHGFCFAEWRYFTPVSMFAEFGGILQEDAARQLLDLAGYRPASWQQRWHQLLHPVAEVDKTSLVASLQIWLTSRYPGWEQRQYDAAVASALAKCLGLLSLVTTGPDCRQWLSGSQQVMAQVLERR